MFSRLWKLIFLALLATHGFYYGRWFFYEAWPSTMARIGTQPFAEIIQENDVYAIIRNVVPDQTNTQADVEVVLVTINQDYKNRFAGEVRYELLPQLPREYSHLDPSLPKIIEDLKSRDVIISQVPIEIERPHEAETGDNIFVYTLL